MQTLGLVLTGLKSECLVLLSDVTISIYQKYLSSESSDVYVPFLCLNEWDNWPFLILERWALKATWFVVKVSSRHYRDIASWSGFS